MEATNDFLCNFNCYVEVEGAVLSFFGSGIDGLVWIRVYRYFYKFGFVMSDGNNDTRNVTRSLLLHRHEVLLRRRVRGSLLFFCRVLGDRRAYPDRILRDFMAVISRVCLFISSARARTINGGGEIRVVVL